MPRSSSPLTATWCLWLLFNQVLSHSSGKLKHLLLLVGWSASSISLSFTCIVRNVRLARLKQQNLWCTTITTNCTQTKARSRWSLILDHYHRFGRIVKIIVNTLSMIYFCINLIVVIIIEVVVVSKRDELWLALISSNFKYVWLNRV